MLSEDDAARAKAGKVVLPDSPSRGHHSFSKVSDLRQLHGKAVDAHRAQRDQLYELIDLYEAGVYKKLFDRVKEIVKAARGARS